MSAKQAAAQVDEDITALLAEIRRLSGGKDRVRFGTLVRDAAVNEATAVSICVLFELCCIGDSNVCTL